MSTKSVSEVDTPAYSPYGKWVKQLQKGQGLDTSIKDKYFSNERKNSDEIEEEPPTPKDEDTERMQRKQRRLQKKYQEQQRINDMKLKQFMKKQRRMKDKMMESSQASTIKDQINAAIERSNKSKDQ